MSFNRFIIQELMSFNRFIIQERLAGQVIHPRATTLRLQLQPADGARSSERC